jgi:hypothetical protein
VGDTTVVYVSSTDSAGRFTIANLAAGSYNVRGISDENSNRALDPREAWDSVAVALTDTASAELLAFVHDSLGARLSVVTLRDSVTIELLFDNPLSVSAPLTPASIRVRAPDSSYIPIASVTNPPPDTTAGVRRPSRPTPVRSVVVTLGRPLVRRTEYRISVTDARNLLGIMRSSERTLSVPAAPPPPAAPPAPPPAPPPAGQPIRR